MADALTILNDIRKDVRGSKFGGLQCDELERVLRAERGLADQLLAATSKLMAALHMQALVENTAASDDGSTGIKPETWATATEAANADYAAAWTAANLAIGRYIQARGLTAQQIHAMTRNPAASAPAAPAPEPKE